MKAFRNPFITGYADPDVLLYRGVYYMYATSYHVRHGYEVYASEDLVNWENKGVCIESAYGMDRGFWAPDVKEKDGVFYMLVTVSEHICLATSDSPLGPFVPQPGLLLDHSIDGHIFFEGGDMFVYCVSWREGHPYGLYGMKMMPDRITPDLGTERLLFRASEPYECHQAPVVEAPYMLKKDGVYYLTYSGSHYESPFYCVAYATAADPLGPFTRYEGNPILVADGKTVSGAGHHCFTTSPDGRDLFIVYHTHLNPGKIHPRCLNVEPAGFIRTPDGKTVLSCPKADLDEHPYPLEDPRRHDYLPYGD